MYAPTPASLRADVAAGLADARTARDAFVALASDEAFAVVAVGFDSIRRPLDACREGAALYAAAHPDARLRDVAEALEQETARFETVLSLDRAVYERLAGLDLERAADPEARRLVERALRDFRRSGVDRDDATRARVRALQEELVEIGQRFDRNIVHSTRTLRLEDGHAALAGMPADFLATHPVDAEGAVTLSTDPPDYIPVMAYAERDDVRRRLLHEATNRAPENLAILDELLAKRHELATLLGYPSWAAYVTEDKMVRSAEAVDEFIDRVARSARPLAEAEHAQLLDELRRIDAGAQRVELHQQRYLVERVKRLRRSYDSQEARQYFAYARVKDGVLATSARLFGVEFRRDGRAPVWHESVEAWELLDGGAVVARFYLDMFPREGKFKHAAMFSLRHGIAGEVLPEGALVCNFPRPTAGDPGLLLHGQVTTFFHEFGHLLHHLFGGRQRYLRFSGINTEWDFVEVPSQLYEEWAWDAGVLGTFATHHETGAPIPADLVRRLRAAEDFGKGLHVAQQMFYASVSLRFHSGDPRGLDTSGEVRRLRAALTPLEEPADSHMQSTFGHLNSYSAIYYTYMWSLVIAKDLFAAFAADPMDAGPARTYRDAVLVRAFLGRDTRFAAWESWLAS